MLVCDLGLDQALLYRVQDGKLITHREVDLPPGSGPRHLYSITPQNNGYI